MSISIIHHAGYLFLAMVGVGIAWASFNSIPFAMVASVTPDEQMGLSMGVFNIAVCLPQIIVSLFVGFILRDLLHNNTVYLIIISGVFYIIAALLTIPIKDKNAIVTV